MKKTRKSKVNHIDYYRIASLSVDDLYTSFESDPMGLDDDEVQERLDEDGYNIIRHKTHHTIIYRFMESLINPFNVILLIISAVTFFTDVINAAPGQQDYTTVIIIITLVFVSTLMSFIQEERSNKAASNLLDMVTNTVSVYREKKLEELPITELVVGDMIKLGAGDLIPADIRYLSTKDMFISQATLTGESDSVEKLAELQDNAQSITDLSNISFMGSNVVSGSATAIVIATGEDTYIGSMSVQLDNTKTKSSFERGVSSISSLLLRLMLILVPLVFVINGISKQNWGQAFLFAVSLAVGLTPEMLPVVMSTGLGRGAIAMSKHQTIVKNLSGIQTFGEMDILCTDKTGTLTEDEIILERYMDVHGQDDKRVLRHGFMNSYFQTGLKNLIDIAIINRAKSEGIDSLSAEYKCIDEIPFDFSRRRMSVVVQNVNGKRQLITKGAVEEIMAISSFVEYNGEILPLTQALRDEAMDVYLKYNDQGLRMIAVAQKNEIPDEHHFSVSDESEMVLIGFIGFLDPPKESAAPTIKSLHDHGVEVVVLTGDSLGVAVKVCDRVGIPTVNAMVGHEIEALNDDELREAIQKGRLFAKLSPIQKQRIVKGFQSLGHTVGYMGDGINDALSLKQADVGISVDSAVDIAKETAGIILLKKDLRVLEEGIIEGRKTFGNIIKYIKLAVSGNFGNMISVIIASIFLPFLPMLPIHLLTQNLLCDFAQLGIPFDNVDDDYLKHPQKWNTKSITSFMLVFGPISSVFDIVTYVIAWFVLHMTGATPLLIREFQTFWFVFGILSQVLIIHFIRTNKIPFIQSKPSKGLVFSTLGIALVTLILVYSKIAFAIDLATLPLYTIGWLGLVIVGYACATLIGKYFYIKHFRHWL